MATTPTPIEQPEEPRTVSLSIFGEGNVKAPYEMWNTIANEEVGYFNPSRKAFAYNPPEGGIVGPFVIEHSHWKVIGAEILRLCVIHDMDYNNAQWAIVKYLNNKSINFSLSE